MFCAYSSWEFPERWPGLLWEINYSVKHLENNLRMDLNLVPSHLRAWTPEHSPILHLEPGVPPSPPLVKGTWMKVPNTPRHAALVCTARLATVHQQHHRHQMLISLSCPCPIPSPTPKKVGTSTFFVSAAQSHSRESNRCYSRPCDCFIPKQRGTDLRKELAFKVSSRCVKTVFSSHFKKYFIYLFLEMEREG